MVIELMLLHIKQKVVVELIVSYDTFPSCSPSSGKPMLHANKLEAQGSKLYSINRRTSFFVSL